MSASLLLERSERITLLIDSEDRTAGTNEDFTLTLDPVITRVKQVEIVTIEIPFSFYVITSTNYTLNFEDNVATPLTINITPGNYSGTSFATELQTQMNTQMAGFTVSYDDSIYKLRFQNATNFKLILASSTLAPVMGLLADTALATDTTLTGIANLSGPNYILIKSEALTRPKKIKPYFGANQTNVFYKMPIQTGPGTSLLERNMFSTGIRFPVRQTLRTLDFKLEDPDGVALDLNGVRWSMTLVVDTL